MGFMALHHFGRCASSLCTTLVWACTLLFLYTNQALSQSTLPNQPVQFQNRPLSPQPFLVYSFRQHHCVSADNQLQPDVGGPLPISRLANASTCPSSGNPNVFNNAMIGYTVTNIEEENAIMSSAIGTSFDPLTVESGPTSRKKMSIEVWFSVAAEFEQNKEYTLVEIGSLESGVDAAALDGHQMKVSYRKRITSDELTVEYIYRSPADELRSFSFYAPDFDKLEEIGTSPGKVFMLILSISSTSELTMFLGDLGGTLGDTTMGGSNEIRRFVFPDTSRLRLGCTRSTSGNVGFPGSIHFLAFYNDTIDLNKAEAFLGAGLPNSLPAVRSVWFIVNEDQESALNLNVTGVSVFDFDGNPVARFRILSLPDRGRLIFDGVPVTANNFPVLDASLLTFVSDQDGFSVLSGTATCDNVYTTFTFDASDGLCDHTTTQQDLSEPNCNSPVRATATICVRETNDAPKIIGSEGPFTVFAESENRLAFSITCQDKDEDYIAFGLARVVITGQMNSSLGELYITPDGSGACEGGIIYEGSEESMEATVPIMTNESYTWHFCYKAKPTSVTTMDVGMDIISYRCEDQVGGSVSGEVYLAVKNALIPGCGTPATTRAEWAAGVPCSVVGMEDEPMFVTLNGLDIVMDHTSEFRRYKIVTLPRIGRLTLLNGTAVTAGQIIKAHDGSVMNVAGIGGVDNYTTTDGNLTLIYHPALDHFTAICCLDINPNSLINVERHATCPTYCGVNPRFTDALGKPFNECANPTGCPVTFSFALGYLDAEDVLSFSDVFVDGFRITVLGVNDAGKTSYLRLSSGMTILETSKNYFINEIEEGQQAGYYDPDGDTFRVGFVIETVDIRAYLILSEPFDNPLVDGVKTRLSWMRGEDCFSSGRATCDFQGKAYQSDLNRLLAQLAFRTTESERFANGTFILAVYDQVYEPYDFEKGSCFSLYDFNVTKKMSIMVDTRVDSATSGSDNYVRISTTISAAISAWLLLVIM